THSFLRRAHQFLTFSNPSRATFAVKKVPVDVSWGRPSTFGDNSNFLCLQGSSTPVLVWFVGEVVRGYFVDNDGFPAKRVGLSFQPLSGDTSAVTRTVLNTFSTVAERFGPDQVRATKWMTRRGAAGQAQTVVEFEEIFDARQALKSKPAMSRLSTNDIGEHAIVLLEARIAHYFDRVNRQANQANVARWQAFLDMQAVYLLK
ncbi:hypothetical protein C8J57DRAFT_953755, partial [Mycena rebaudengoi]